MKIETTDELRKAYPNLIKQVEARMKMRIIERKGGSSFTEDETVKLTEEEKKKIRAAAKLAAQ